MSERERKFGEPFPKPLEYAFLSSKMGRALGRYPVNNERDRILFKKGAGFFDRALKGVEAARKLQITSTSADDTRAFSDALEVLSALPQASRISREEDIDGFLTGAKDTLNALVSSKTEEVDSEQIGILRAFFDKMRGTIGSSEAKPLDVVRINQ